MNKHKYRDLSNYEIKILAMLLEEPFLGRDEIRKQLDKAKVREIAEYNDNYGSIEFLIDTNLKALVPQRVPVEGKASDVDKVPIDILLHIIDGKVSELEFVKADGTAIKTLPSPEEIKIEIR